LRKPLPCRRFLRNRYSLCQSLAVVFVPWFMVGSMYIGPLNGFEATPRLATYTKQREAEFDQISVDRRATLDELAGYISQRVGDGAPIRLTFICTHNSRRSQLAQVWSAFAATR